MRTMCVHGGRAVRTDAYLRKKAFIIFENNSVHVSLKVLLLFMLMCFFGEGLWFVCFFVFLLGFFFGWMFFVFVFYCLILFLIEIF